MDDQKPSRKFPVSGVLIAFIALVILAGNNPVAVRFSNLELPPFWGAATRLIVASLIYWVIVMARRTHLPRGRALLGAFLFGFFSFGLFLGAFYWSLQKINPGMASVFLAMAPLLTFFFVLAHRQEKFRWTGLIGAVLALGGIMLGLGRSLSGAANQAQVPLVLLLVLLFGVACQSYGAVLYKHFPRSDPPVVNALAMSTGALMLIIVSLGTGETWSLPRAPATWAAFAYLAVLGTVVVFYLQLFVLNRWTATATSYGLLLLPVVTVASSAWLTGEKVTPQFVIGVAIVMTGVWIGALAPFKPVPCPEKSQALKLSEAGCQD